jgi:hypothetical protein
MTPEERAAKLDAYNSSEERRVRSRVRMEEVLATLYEPRADGRRLCGHCGCPVGEEGGGMLIVLMLLGGALLAWMLLSWFEYRDMQAMMREFGQRFPGRCPVCSLEEHCAREMIPLKRIDHHCREHTGRGDVVPSAGHEVASALSEEV